MTKQELIEQIQSVVDAEQYEVYGLRVDNYNYNIGDMCFRSHQLYQDAFEDDDGNLIYPQGEGIYADYYDAGELPGTCALVINKYHPLDTVLVALSPYACLGDYIYLVASNYCEGGNDPGEVIISDARVLLKMSKSELY